MTREEAITAAKAMLLRYGCEFEDDEDGEVWELMTMLHFLVEQLPENELDD